MTTGPGYNVLNITKSLINDLLDNSIFFNHTIDKSLFNNKIDESDKIVSESIDKIDEHEVYNVRDPLHAIQNAIKDFIKSDQNLKLLIKKVTKLSYEVREKTYRQSFIDNNIPLPHKPNHTRWISLYLSICSFLPTKN